MKYFFPDSQDLVDPTFNFEREDRSLERVRRHDKYAHEVFSTRAYDGLLVSMGIVEGFGESGSRYTMAQRNRLRNSDGAQQFFRTAELGLPIMGDCGAFTYVREAVPPYTVDQVLDFYDDCQFEFGISVDHVILMYQPKADESSLIADSIPDEVKQRQSLTLELAAEFFARHRSRKLKFQPIGVAQGWSPGSYACAVQTLQKIGFTYIALGGMVPLKTNEILSSLAAISNIRSDKTRLHLLGVTRTDHVADFANYGVVSFDSTSPLRQAFKDDKDNYYTLDRTYTAIRIPQVEGNPNLQRQIAAGVVSQDRARKLEKLCLEKFGLYDTGRCSLDEALDAIVEYDSFCVPNKNLREVYREVLTDRPWSRCLCDICKSLGRHVIIFRGAERNRRRGFHNVWVFYRRLQRELGLSQT